MDLLRFPLRHQLWVKMFTKEERIFHLLLMVFRVISKITNPIFLSNDQKIVMSHDLIGKRETSFKFNSKF